MDNLVLGSDLLDKLFFLRKRPRASTSPEPALTNARTGRAIIARLLLNSILIVIHEPNLKRRRLCLGLTLPKR
jgi:hypothetical protein